MLKKLKISILIVLQCNIIVHAIKVPVEWNEGDHSEIEDNNKKVKKNADILIPQNVPKKFVPVEYFEYTAKKPEFAVEIANYFGAPLPAKLYKAHPINPFTEVKPPQLGNHQLLRENNKIFHPYQSYVSKINRPPEKNIIPTSSYYKVFHPYKEEEPALRAIYKDPVLDKIRSDLQHTKNEHQDYVENTGNSDITKSEYLESPDETDKKVPQRNIPAQFEIHKPHRNPTYYKVPYKFINRDPILNKKFKHPWNHNYIKIRPVHYQPLKKHLQKLRQHHAFKYDDEKNEYPQVLLPEKASQPQEGYDIYENAKLKYNHLRNNVDESINKAILQNRPANYQKLEFENDNSDNNDDEEDFVPVKNYAQVRKSETIKHLPREAALEEASTLDEIKNAPRLREAVKQTKAQTVYTEEGYEDAAYDHAGEQKHASDNEGHGGYLKQYELSKGKFKTPSENIKYANEEGAAYGDKVLHKEKWNNINQEDEIESENISDIEHQGEFDIEKFQNDSEEKEETFLRNKREQETKNESQEKNHKHNFTEHDVSKRDANFNVPKIDLSSTYLTEKEILKLAKRKLNGKKENLNTKYPYYFDISENINKHSPLRYAENLSNIPKKSKSGTAFYDSMSYIKCQEVDENVDPIPDKLKKDGQSDGGSSEDDNHGGKNGLEKKIDQSKEIPRLKGLGDKIDCFKTKYFGPNPLDSPFFNEELIMSPEPPNIPNSKIFKIKNPIKHYINPSEQAFNKRDDDNNLDLFHTFNELRKNLNSRQSPGIVIDGLDLLKDFNKSLKNSNKQQNILLKDIFFNIKNNTQKLNTDINKSINVSSLPYKDIKNISTLSYQKEDDLKVNTSRKKRETPFVYEPYKIIKEGQVKDIKKIQSTVNASPLIKKLQLSKVADKVNKKSEEVESSFVDVNTDTRRGEPRYELKPSNHKLEYIPVENKKSISIEDYEAQLNVKNKSQKINTQAQKEIISEGKHKKQPVYDIVSFLPSSPEIQVASASKNIRRMIKSRTEAPKTNHKMEATENKENADIEENDEEYDDYMEENTTSTTTKPFFKKRPKTSTEKPQEEPLKIRLVTRFRTSTTTEKTELRNERVEKPETIEEGDLDISRPKYREKKTKSSKSTLVTDSKSYGDDSEDDMKKTEVDALIGVKQNMEDYMPEYEKNTKKLNRDPSPDSEEEEDESEEEEEEDYDDDEADDEIEENDKEILTITTPEPTKRTLLKTTDAPRPTTETHDENLTLKPIIMKKIVEIHKELPANTSSPQQSQFRQKIHEIEVIKEIPAKIVQKNSQKNLEALEFYKDDSLVKDVNKLKDVEIFKPNLDFKNGPRHGGNYRSAETTTRTNDQINGHHRGNLKAPIEDVETSQTESKKLIELEEIPSKRLHGGNLKSLEDFQRSRGSRGRSSKLIELSDSSQSKPSAMHGGNLKFSRAQSRDHNKGKSAKLIELDEEHDEEEESSDSMHGGNYNHYGNSQSRKPLHGGNYRSAKIVQSDDKKQRDVSKNKQFITSTNGKNSAAVLLSGFAQAAPLLTTTPAYILDPSKRMYYYVDV